MQLGGGFQVTGQIIEILPNNQFKVSYQDKRFGLVNVTAILDSQPKKVEVN